MHELEACETCRWWVPDPGTPPPVPRENKFQRGEKIIKDICEKVSVCEDLQGIKQMHAMALEEEFKRPFVCVEIREVQEYCGDAEGRRVV